MATQVLAFAESESSSLALDVGCRTRSERVFKVSVSGSRARRIAMVAEKRKMIKRSILKNAMSEGVAIRRMKQLRALPAERSRHGFVRDLTDQELSHFDMGL